MTPAQSKIIEIYDVLMSNRHNQDSGFETYVAEFKLANFPDLIQIIREQEAEIERLNAAIDTMR